MEPRFLTLTDVAEILNVSAVQARRLVLSGELPAIQVGGRGVWRVDKDQFEAYIDRKHEETRTRVTTRPLLDDDGLDGLDGDGLDGGDPAGP